MKHLLIISSIVLGVIFTGCVASGSDHDMSTTALYVESTPYYDPFYDPFYGSYRPFHHYPPYRHQFQQPYTHKIYTRNFAHMRHYENDPEFWYPYNFYLGGYVWVYNGHKYVQTKEISPSPLKGFQGETIRELPSTAHKITINSKVYYISRSIIYRKIETEAGDMYEATGMMSE